MGNETFYVDGLSQMLLLALSRLKPCSCRFIKAASFIGFFAPVFCIVKQISYD